MSFRSCAGLPMRFWDLVSEPPQAGCGSRSPRAERNAARDQAALHFVGENMANKRLFLAFREPGPSWAPGVHTREQRLWDEHAAFMDDLYARGHVVLAGPYADGSGRALVILDAG